MIRTTRAVLHRILLLSAVLTLALPAQAQTLASMGKVQLTAQDVTLLTQSRPGLKAQILASDAVLENVLRQELLRRALVAEARGRGWDQRPDIVAAIEAAREQVILNTYMNRIAQLPQGYPDEAAVKAYYEANQATLTVAKRHHLAQIFIARPTDASKVAQAQQRATGIATRARRSDADFAAIAKAESEEASSRAKGGDLGWVAEGNILPEIRAILAQLSPGAVSNAVETANGWHIVRLIESRPQGPATLEEARAAIIARLRADRAAALRKAYVDEMLKNTPPTVDTAALSALRGTLK